VTALVATLVVAVFALAFAWLRVPARARESFVIAAGAQRMLGDPDLDDATREARAQAAARRLFYVGGVIVLRTAAAIGAATLPMLLADRLGAVPAASVVAFLSRPDVIVIAAVALVVPWFLASRRRA